MAEKKTAAKRTAKSSKRTTASTDRTTTPRSSAPKLTAEERAAMKEYTKELKAQAAKADGEEMLRAAIAKMNEPDRAMAKRVDKLVTAAAPELEQRTWYGMPAYAKDGEVVCFFQDAAKFKSRYATFGFSDAARLDKGGMWPVAFALEKLTPAEEAKIGKLVKQAVR